MISEMIKALVAVFPSFLLLSQIEPTEAQQLEEASRQFVVGVALVPLLIGSTVLGSFAAFIRKLQADKENQNLKRIFLDFVSSSIVGILVVGLAYEWVIKSDYFPTSDALIMCVGCVIGILCDTFIPYALAAWKKLYERLLSLISLLPFKKGSK